MDLIEEDILMHYGVKRRSGRYPWGSGDNPYQHGGDFLARVEELQRLGKTEKQIADELHLSTTDLRMQVRVAKHERRALQADRARSLREDGKTLDEIASILGYANDSSVRALLNENTAANKNKAQATAEILKKELAEKGAIDVGTGVERQLGVSTGVLQEALFILETEGYNRYGVGVPQVNDPKKRTITPVISVPEIDQREVYQNLDLVKSVGDYHSTDGGESWDKREYPASIDSSRVKILYGDEGGALKDGVIEIRRGVADLDLGDSHYAQVRILVDGTHYLKGMAMYSDDMPDGADIVFNTNKHTGTPKMDVLKKIQDDPDNPFGALIKANGQSHYIDADGNEKLSAINKLKEEGDWDKMSKNLSSQFLSKQPIQLKLPAAMRNKYEQFMDEGSLVVLDGTVLDPMQVYEDLDEYIVACGYDVRCFGYDPYNAKEFVERWAAENGPFGIEKVIQGAKTESVPLGELKKLAEDRMLLFDEELMTYAMGNCIAMEDTNGNRKLMKKRYEQKIDAVSAMMDAYIAYKRNPEAFE